MQIFLAKAEQGNYLDIRVRMEQMPPDEEQSDDATTTRGRVKLLQEIESVARRLHALETAHADAMRLPPPSKFDSPPRRQILKRHALVGAGVLRQP